MAKTTEERIKELEAELQKLKKQLEKESKTKKGTTKKPKEKDTSKKVDTKTTKVSKKGTKKVDPDSTAISKKGATKTGKGTRTVDPNTKFRLKSEASSKWHLITEIKKSPLYGKTKRDEIARKWLEKRFPIFNRNKFVPGQLIMFNYFTPKTEEQLEYYDARPTTIFFGIVNTKEGKRYLGFNIHYYPPQMRYLIMNKIFEMYRGIFVKYFKDGVTKEIDAFTYKILIKQLNRANLGFGVRMYIPQLVTEPRNIPPNAWQVAVFTEGHFKKKTRTQIMGFWKRWLKGDKKNSPSEQIKHPKYKSKRKS